VNDSLWTFVFEIANFVALAAVLAWLLFKPVRKALADQQAKARQLEDDAAQKLTDAESLRQDVESQRQALAGELETMRVRVREIARQEAEQILAEARAHAERERAALKRDALHIERAQMTKIARAVATATHDTMKRFLQQMEGPELEQTLLKAACRELKAFSNNPLAPVTIESAAPLDDDARRLINASLGVAAKSADFRVVPGLEGGLRISTAHGLIDASVTGLANFAEQSLSAEMESIIREEDESE
jgi:F-type H+-transporting ATPase subunit b